MGGRHIVFFLIVILFAINPAGARSIEELRVDYIQARNLYIEGNYPDAITKFENIVFLNVDANLSANSQYLIGECYYKMEKYDKAYAEYSKVFMKYPLSEFAEGARLKMGFCYFKMKNYDNCVNEFNGFINDFPSSKYITLSYMYIAQSYQEKKEYTRAIDTYNKRIHNFPDNNFSAMYFIGECNEGLDNYPEAMNTYRRYIELDPTGQFVERAKMRLKLYAEGKIPAQKQTPKEVTALKDSVVNEKEKLLTQKEQYLSKLQENLKEKEKLLIKKDKELLEKEKILMKVEDATGEYVPTTSREETKPAEPKKETAEKPTPTKETRTETPVAKAPVAEASPSEGTPSAATAPKPAEQPTEPKTDTAVAAATKEETPAVKPEEKPTAEPTELGVTMLTVTSEPAGLDVMIDTKVAGKTPISVKEIKPGIHKIRLSVTDYETFIRKVDVKEKVETKVDAIMVKQKLFELTQSPSKIDEEKNKGGFLFFGGGYKPYKNPVDIGCDISSNVYVLDMEANCVVKYISGDTAGKKVVFGKEGKDKGSFSGPLGIWVLENGGFYVADAKNSRIQKFDSSGKALAEYKQSKDFKISSPVDVAVNSKGVVYFADKGDNTVKAVEGSDSAPKTKVIVSCTSPAGIYIDGSDNVYVVDQSANKIKRVSQDGTVAEFGEKGLDFGQLNMPANLCVAKDGTIYVCDSKNSRIQIFDGGLNFSGLVRIRTIEKKDKKEEVKKSFVISSPVGIEIDRKGNLVVISDKYVNKYKPVQ